MQANQRRVCAPVCAAASAEAGHQQLGVRHGWVEAHELSGNTGLFYVCAAAQQQCLFVQT